MTGLAEWGGLLGALVAFLGLAGSVSYWLIRNAIVVATKDYLDNKVERNIDPVRESLDDAVIDVRKNKQEMEALRDLLEGGSSDFEKGMMDFLEENIERTVEIQQDLGSIAEALDNLESRVDRADIEDENSSSNYTEIR
jgi:hypothetical protein